MYIVEPKNTEKRVVIWKNGSLELAIKQLETRMERAFQGFL